ncbi:hypothetical protein NDU88_004159 [Pleurodeles waltl]|uniref:Uncharacterized protein n=1 Tax=Pleurodeles waltl TaxID=8319 RepID=A0AAV7QEN8_PLEWA|nr:hypothetical protein NDU88_004158 [Pleurodeles waltl]KAJ1137763.1 hypothetical protein NDU88_004159 [Pleurodeles waltl]
MAVSGRLEGMDSNISALTAKTKSIHSDFAGFQNHMVGLETRITLAEDRLNMLPDRDQELRYLRSKVIDLEDRSCRDNVSFFGIPECIEGSDVKHFLRDTLPSLKALTFHPPLELQRAHRIGPVCQDHTTQPCPIIACLLRHEQARQLLTAARSHGPYMHEGHGICIAADFSQGNQ